LSNEEKFWYLFWAYNVIWLLMGAYLLFLGVRQARLRRLLERLREKVDHEN